VPLLLTDPAAEGGLGNGDGVALGIYFNGGIGAACMRVYKQVIIPLGQVIMSCESFVPEKEGFSVCKVSSHTHVRLAFQGK
jgi:L-aminopeptidase/D-esterase-like protein